MDPFYILVNDHKNKKYAVVGPMRDDTLITSNIANMQRANFDVNCHIADENQASLAGYTKEDRLYSNLIEEYNKQTNQNMKKW